jgi:3-oxoacyl-[acyl-carrier protein] reductase
VNRPVALITGGSRGIGRAVAEELVSTHRLIITYNSNPEAAAEVARRTHATVFQCALHSRESRDKLVTALRDRFEGIDLLVNNAGMAPRQRLDLLDATEESFDELIGTNLKGPYFLTQKIARWMVECKTGRIVFITSVNSFTASVNRGEYCVSKAGLSMAAQLFATRLAAHQIHVFEIQPGIIRTDMIASVSASYEERIADGLLPQGRMGEPEDVARAVRAIADGHLDYATGQILNVDGGFHMRSL